MMIIAGWIVIIATVVLTGLLIALHVLPTGLSPFADPVSRYALTRFGALYRWATIAAAAAGVGAAVIVADRFSGVAATVTIVLLAVFTVARALIGFFPMDDPAAARTTIGTLHGALAFLAFAAITAAAFVAGGAFHDGGAPSLATLSTATGVVMAVGTVGMIVASRTARARGLFGAAERLIYLGFLIWFFALGITAVTKGFPA